MKDMSKMVKYGMKHTCFKCGCKFYDLNRPKPICPKCNADQTLAPPPPKEIVEELPEERHRPVLIDMDNDENDAIAKDSTPEFNDDSFDFFEDYDL